MLAPHTSAVRTSTLSGRARPDCYGALLLCLLGAICLAPVVRAADVQPPVMRAADAPELDARRLIQLGSGDSVKVEVYGQPDMTTTVLIGDDGAVGLALVGDVQIGGLSPVDAGRKVEAVLKSKGILNDPHVTISLMQSRSQRVAVLGEVRLPGRYTIEPNTTVFDLLAQAGGVAETGADFGYVLRPDSNGELHRFTVQLSGAGRSSTLASQSLQGGDTLYIPRSQQFYIYGQVTASNMYRLEAGMTVLQAVARAGGITPRGSDRRIEIKRMGKDGRYEVLHAKLSDLVEPDDVIRVKESIF
jgi:polysaccharide biosynthesis/export protein